MTTNHIEQLDPALIRDGRADLYIEFKLASRAVMAELFHRMFDSYDNDLEPVLVPVKDPLTGIVKYTIEKPKVDSEDFSADELKKMSEKFANMIPDENFSPAEIQGFLLRFKRHPKKAIDATEKWVQDVLAEREKRKQKDADKVLKEAEEEKNKVDKKDDTKEGTEFAGPKKEDIIVAIKEALADVIKELVNFKLNEKTKASEMTHSGGAAAGMEGQIVKSSLDVKN